MSGIYSPHGFVWPDGLPPCGQCGMPASNQLHVTPSPGALVSSYATMAASEAPKSLSPTYTRSHPYVLSRGLAENIRCVACNGTLHDSSHPIGMPSGRLQIPAPQTAAVVAEKEVAFVANIGDRIVLATRGRVDTMDDLPATLAALASTKREAQSANLWIAGRYVEAERANRNMAYWSADDLQLGQPTVDHGPINWLHQERHIIGALAYSEYVPVEREAAAESGVGSHIAALGALWPWIAREETGAIRDASENGRLWFSMECVSREVACMEDGCGHSVEYKPYMKTQETSRCEHMKAGGVRRFVDPIFEGAGIIVPPTEPGWANAEARVLMPKAEALVERNAAAFSGASDEDAVRVVAALMGPETIR
jgi:hypothetical protein